MKIVYLVTDLSGSHGWSTYALNIITEAVNNKHEVFALVHKKTDHDIVGVTQFEILPSPHTLLWNPVRILMTAVRVAVTLSKISPGIVHVVVETYLQLFYVLPKKKYYKLIATLHGTYSRLPLAAPTGYRRQISALFFKGALKRVDTIISVSERTKKIFIEFFPEMKLKKIEVVHNSIVLPEMNDATVSQRNHSRYSVITVGAVKRRKGIHHAIKFLSEWSKENKRSVVYNVVGVLDQNSDYVKNLCKDVQTYSHQYFSVIFHGMVSEGKKRELLQQSDLYVHLEDMSQGENDVEGFGIGIIEAASFGVPALVACGSATSEAVLNHISGLVVDIHKEFDVATAISRILRDEHLNINDICAWARQHQPNLIFGKIVKLYTSE